MKIFSCDIITNIHEIMEEGDVEEDDDMKSDMILTLNILQEPLGSLALRYNFMQRGGC